MDEDEKKGVGMAAARTQIERQLSALQATERIVRQEEITAEITELAAGETASRSDHARQRSSAGRHIERPVQGKERRE